MKLEIVWEKGLGIGNGHRMNPCWQAHASAGLGDLERGPWGLGQVAGLAPLLRVGLCPLPPPAICLLCDGHLPL